MDGLCRWNSWHSTQPTAYAQPGHWRKQPSVENFRTYGSAPCKVAVVHGGPGAAGEMAPVARELAYDRGILEPLQTATTLEYQIEELCQTLETRAALPVALLGFSWGAWLSYIVAARYPGLVRKLMLIASGPFVENYAPRIQATRLKRLDAQQQEEWQTISKALNDSSTANKDALLARLGVLASITDNYDPLATDPEISDRISPKGEIFQSVWTQAAQWRKNGKLLEFAKRIQCPVVALHGDYDPHPAEGVQDPLATQLKDFRMIMLKSCGHTPWRERQAREGFYRAIRRELP
jgi:pimeloyl-ACP methyl ester carboxylesterase